MEIEKIYEQKILTPEDSNPFFKKSENPVNKAHLIYALIRQQLTTWPLLKEAYENFNFIKSRRIPIDRADFEVNYNPLRIANVTAIVDRKMVESKNCFLCPSFLDEQQRGVVIENLVVLVNPKPVFLNHLTLVGDHTPQHISSNMILKMLKLVYCMRPFHVFYNGPGIGATLPNHFHLQALPCPLPLENTSLEKISEINRELQFHG